MTIASGEAFRIRVNVKNLISQAEIDDEIWIGDIEI